MNCPGCGSKTRVTNSRHADSSKWGPNSKLIKTAREAVGWYTYDWVARTRVCSSCTWKDTTVEVTAEDWREMQAALKGGFPDGESEE